MGALITLYSKENCCLCEDMQSQLAGCLPPGIELIVVKINGQPELEQAYGARVPVLTANDKEICEGRLDKAALARTLDETGTKTV